MSQLSFVDSSQDGNNYPLKKNATPPHSIVVRKIPVASSSKKRRQSPAEPPKSNEKISCQLTPRFCSNKKRPHPSKKISKKRSKQKSSEMRPSQSGESSLRAVPTHSSIRVSARPTARNVLQDSSSESEDALLFNGNGTRIAHKKTKPSRLVKRKLPIVKRAVGDADLDTEDDDSHMLNRHHRRARTKTARTKTKVLDADSESDNDGSNFDMIPTQELDVPYAQNLGLPGDDAKLLASSLSNKRKEPLRPGDVILYHNPMFVAGTRQSLRVTQVVKTDPTQRNIPLELDNGEILPSDTRVKRIREYYDGNLYDHPGIFRFIRDFRFTAKSLSPKERSILPGLRTQVLRLMEKVIASANAALEEIPESFDEEEDNSSSSSSSSGDSDKDSQARPRVAHKHSQRSFKVTKTATRSTRKLPFTHNAVNDPSNHRLKTPSARNNPTPELPNKEDSSSDDTDDSSIDFAGARYASGSALRKASPLPLAGERTSQPGLSFSKCNSRRFGSASSESKHTSSTKQHRRVRVKLRQKQAQPDGCTPEDGAVHKNDSHASPMRRRRRSIDPYAPEAVDKEQILWSNSSSDYESVASSTLSKPSSVAEQPVVMPNNAKPQKALTITRRKSRHDSQGIAHPATTTATRGAPPSETAASKRSVFQPTELEPEDDVGDAESSDDENLFDGAPTFFPSAHRRREEGDRGYSSIASSSFSASPQRKSFVKLLKKKRRNQLVRPSSQKPSSSAALGMRLQFQEIPR